MIECFPYCKLLKSDFKIPRLIIFYFFYSLVSYFLEILPTIDIGFDYVDLELKIEDSRRDALITKAKENGVRTIMSSHDFERTPDWKKIVALINKCKNIGDHIKLVFHNTSYVDSMNILKAGKAALAQNFKFSVMGMGPFGHITRILAPTIGSEFACASLKQDKEAVEGQVDIKTLLEMWEILEFV